MLTFGCTLVVFLLKSYFIHPTVDLIKLSFFLTFMSSRCFGLVASMQSGLASLRSIIPSLSSHP